MDLTAENRVIALRVTQTAPPSSIATSLGDLLELYNRKSPKKERVADKMTSKSVDILLIKIPQLRYCLQPTAAFVRNSAGDE